MCAAGGAAHLAGAVAAHTTLPVIGVPVATEPFQGLDSLLSTVQMPPGVPVATVAVTPATSTVFPDSKARFAATATRIASTPSSIVSVGLRP